MADPISIVSGCIRLAKEIYELKKTIEADDAACSDFFYRIQAIQVPLGELEKQQGSQLNTKKASLDQINEALANILNILNTRVTNKSSVFGFLKNAVSSKSGKFSSCLSDLNIQLDRCVSAVQLCTIVDMNAVILDIRAAQLQNQTASADAAATSLFARDPPPVDVYDDRSVLGKGSFGVTHRMINTVDKGVYAVKEIKVSDALSAGIKKDELLKEAMTLQKLNHPHIVRYFTSYFSRNETLFNVVMELISGGSLADKISDPGVSVVDIRRWLSQMASTLHYLHSEMRTQHRDIKAENIMLTSGGGSSGSRIKLIDLGTASAMKTVASKMSRVGTSMYFSYEKANDIPYDGRDDVWGAGCVFAELLLKARLSERGGAVYLFTNRTVNDRRLLLIDECVKVDVGLGSVIGRMLEPEQEHRCTSEELVRLLCSTISSSATLPQAASNTHQKQIESKGRDAAPPVTAVVSPYREKTEQAEQSPVLPRQDAYSGRDTEAKVSVTRIAAVDSQVSTPVNLKKNATSALVNSIPHHPKRTGLFSGLSKSLFSASPKWSLKSSWDVGGFVDVVKFSPDGSVIAVVLNYKDIWKYDRYGTFIAILEADQNVTSHGNILIYDPSGMLITTLRESDCVTCLSFSPDGTKLAATCFLCVKLFDLSSGRLLWSTTLNKDQVCFFNSSSLVASENDESCIIIDVSSGSITRRISADGNVGLCVSDRGTLITAGDSKVTIWDNLDSPRLSFDCSDLLSFCINSDGSLIYVGTTEGDIRVYSDSGLVIREVKKAHGSKSVRSLSMNETNSVLASGGNDDKKVKLWNASTLECIQTLKGHTNWVRSVSFSPNNNNLVSGCWDKTVRVWSYC